MNYEFPLQDEAIFFVIPVILAKRGSITPRIAKKAHFPVLPLYKKLTKTYLFPYEHGMDCNFCNLR